MLLRKGRWQVDADVVVVGYGCAGAVAALAAREAGADVLVLEKQPARPFVTSSFLSGGGFICPSDKNQAISYMEALYRVQEGLYWTEPEIIRTWAEYTCENRQWIEALGATLKLSPHAGEHRLPGVEAMEVYQHPGKGPGLMELLYSRVTERGIRVLHGTPARELLMNGKGEIVGVRASTGEEGGRVVDVRCRRGVVLTTGGFEFNEPMKLQYLRAYPVYFTGGPANTGDGIMMALGAGAQLWHMNCCSGRVVLKFPEVASAFNPAFGNRGWMAAVARAATAPNAEELRSRMAESGGFVVVDRSGRRYTKETFKAHTLYYELIGFDSQRLIFPRIPSYWIFDQARMTKGPLVRASSGPVGEAATYTWSEDNAEELERGWIKKGETIEALADRLGLPSAALSDTVRRYNLSCSRGEDPDFGREPESLVPLDTPPYYAMELWPGGPNTQGGPRRNSKAQVVRADGLAVPRLYSAGELGSIYGMLYPAGGGNLAECIAFGRIAGEQASSEKPL